MVNFLYDGEIHGKEESESLKIIENLQNIFGFQRNLVLNYYPYEVLFPSDNNIEAIAVTKEVSENILDNSDFQDVVIIPPRSKDVSDDLVAIDQGKEDKGNGKVSENKKAPKKIENILDNPNSEKIVIMPLRSRDVNCKLTDSNQDKEDCFLQNGEKKKEKSKKISLKKVRGHSTSIWTGRGEGDHGDQQMKISLLQI